MPVVAIVAIHASQFPEAVRQDLLHSLHSRQVHHKFHYDSVKQTHKWLAHVPEHLKAGETFVVFGEGTTTDGSRLLPFHSNLVAPAIDVGAPIWPIALRYTESGERSDAAAFIGEMGLVTSLARILSARRLAIEVAFVPPIPSDSNRHAVARAARRAIARHLGVAIEPDAEVHLA